MQNKKSRAKFVQNFFKFYGILSYSRKIKNDRERSRIKGSANFNSKLSNTINGDGGSRTLTAISLIYKGFIDINFDSMQNRCKIILIGLSFVDGPILLRVFHQQVSGISNEEMTA